MNSLPENIQDIIYKYKHQLKFKTVLNDLIQHKIYCKYYITLDMLKYMFCVNQCGMRVSCIDVSSIKPSSYEILNMIKHKNGNSI